MWNDDVAPQDFLNFGVLAKVIADVIHQNGDRPLSIGISGAWGVGKSTTLELLAAELEKHESKPLIVRFHPWRHQTQDNVRAAFAECIANTILQNTPPTTKVAEKAKSILKRANLIRIAGYGLGGALTLATGIPFGSFFGKGAEAIAGVIDGNVTKDDATQAADFAGTAHKKIEELFPEGSESQSPYENIEKICKEFADALDGLERRLIVLIDDLDRCLPNTTIEALEAMRLYFFVPKTVFVVAADEEMLRLAVRKHFEVSEQTLDENHLQSYYDKLIQLPFRIPSLTLPDAIVYMTLLVLEQQPDLTAEGRDHIRIELCKKLGQTWDGTRITRTAIMQAVRDQKVKSDFESRISLIERLAPTMVSSKRIGGNPRLIKRFMNSLSVHESLAKLINAPLETSEEVLAKILLLQRCGEKELINELQRDVLKSSDGRSAILTQLEEMAQTVPRKSSSDDKDEDKESDASALWSTEFAKDWLAMDPKLAGIDLRPAFHVSRGADEVLAQAIRLSESTRELLATLKAKPQTAEQFRQKIADIPKDEVPMFMNALVNQLKSAQGSTFTDVLRCCVVVESTHASQSSLLKSTLLAIEAQRWNAGSVTVVKTRPWAHELYTYLKTKLKPTSPTIKAFAQQNQK